MASFPADERFGLTAHLRITAISVPSNIAEGCGRSGDKEFDYQLLLARDLGHLPPTLMPAPPRTSAK